MFSVFQRKDEGIVEIVLCYSSWERGECILCDVTAFARFEWKKSEWENTPL